MTTSTSAGEAVRTPGRFGRSAGFVAVPMLATLSPLLVIPVIAHRFGASGWAAVAIGQSLGAGAAVVVELGWGLSGPQRVARAGARTRRSLLLMSTATKIVVWLPVAVLSALLTTVIVNSYHPAAALSAVAYATAGLSPAWFFIGCGRPWAILLVESLPRILAVALAAGLLAFGAPLIVYSGLLLIGMMVAPIGALAMGRRKVGPTRSVRWHRIPRVIRCQSVALQSRGVSAIYIALPVTLVGVVAPGSVAVFAAGERMQRICLAVLQCIPNYLQGVVGGHRTIEARSAAVSRAVWFSALTGIVAGSAFAALAPWASGVLFSGVVNLPYSASAVCGLVIAITCTSRATGSIGLVAAQRIDAIRLSAVLGALVGIPAIFALSALWGVLGGFVGEVVAESVVLTVQIWVLRTWLQRRSLDKSLQRGADIND